MRVLAALAIGLLWASPALAAEPARDSQEAPREARSVAPRPWLYLDDPTIPDALRAAAQTRVTYTNGGRPFAANVARTVAEASADVSLLPWLALTASAFGDGSTAGGGGGVRASLLPRDSRTHLVLGAGAMRALEGAAGAWGSLAAQQDLGPARLGATVRGEHLFASGRDALDVMVSAGASYAVVGPLRAGAEWVGQDLEGALDPGEAEGGLRSFLGPTAALELVDRTLSIVAGPSFGLSSGSPPLLVRCSLAYAF